MFYENKWKKFTSANGQRWFWDWTRLTRQTLAFWKGILWKQDLREFKSCEDNAGDD